jgi:hypothetical protein
MNPSSALCRAQEVHHRSRAASALLANVRMIDEKAAIAWGVEALVAEKRERRQDQTSALAVRHREKKRLSLEQRGTSTSENPARPGR